MSGTAAVVNGATLQCGHNGVITVTASARLTVRGQGVLLAGTEADLSFAAGKPPCPDTTTDNPPKSAPCTTIAATTGTTTRLTVARTPIVLASANGKTKPALTPAALPAGLTWKVGSPGQSRLTSA